MPARPERRPSTALEGGGVELGPQLRARDSGYSGLRGFDKIVIHPRCRNFQQEARLYKYKTDFFWSLS
jgi:phage terminase large subunit